MTKYNIAYFKEIGIDIAIVPFDKSFGKKTLNEKNETIKNLQIDANLAGIKGTIVPFWKDETNKFFIAPIKLHPFIRGLSWSDIEKNINQEISVRE